MRESNWIRNIIGAIIIVPLFALLAGCGGGVAGVSGSGGGTGGGGGGAASLSATINWTPVTTNIDGSPTDLAGYRVLYGTESGNYTTTVDVADPSADNTVISGLSAGNTYYFVVAAYDISGNQSEFSNEGVKNL